MKYTRKETAYISAGRTVANSQAQTRLVLSFEKPGVCLVWFVARLSATSAPQP